MSSTGRACATRVKWDTTLEQPSQARRRFGTRQRIVYVPEKRRVGLFVAGMFDVGKDAGKLDQLSTKSVLNEVSPIVQS